jgi:hypothetical protein
MTIPVIPSDLQAALCLLLVGGLCLLKSGYLNRKRQLLLDQGIEVTATIVRLEDNPHSDDRTYFPVLRFQTQEQETITAYCYYYSRRRNRFRVGEQMQIYYDPTDPANFLVPSYVGTEIRIYRTIGFGTGLFGLLISLGYMLS